MESSPKVTSALLKRLTNCIEEAVEHQDWDALKQLDMTMGNILRSDPNCLSEPTLRYDIEKLKFAHRKAFCALKKAACELEKKLENMQSEQERAQAYHLAMTMEY
ncbi:hypothetical protein SO574_18900 [Vibrio alfacsensis]|uniref:hypothetical protein n=1 Tax=Vibrio alfacsensis TaxID=1074311 RepID=UPI002ADE5BD3|nr:hypothetical protein [Vibrio alfacsensis]WQE77843.1 hypothetical protein SO574_18900 [Vibrio alfacsensis]